MSDLRKAAEMALEFVEWFASDDHSVRPQHKAPEVVEALRQALAQPEQEPVGYVTIETISSWAKVPSIKWFKKPTQGPLYTAPPKRDLTCVCGAVWDGEQMVHAPRKREWVGLTEDEAIELLPVGDWEIEPTLDFAKAIEAKLKEKNG